MKRCAICGGEIRPGLQYCLNCGAGAVGDSVALRVGNAVSVGWRHNSGEGAGFEEAADSAKTVALPLDGEESFFALESSGQEIQVGQDGGLLGRGKVEPVASEQDGSCIVEDEHKPPSDNFSKDVAEASDAGRQDAIDELTAAVRAEHANQPEVVESDAGADVLPAAVPAEQSALLIRRRTGERFDVACPAIIGKGSNADCRVFGNPAISRQHALIEQDGQGFILSNLSKTNGTRVHGHELALHSRMKIRSGDTLVFADEEFEFRVDGGDSENGALDVGVLSG